MTGTAASLAGTAGSLAAGVFHFPPLTAREFEQFRTLAYQEFGLDLRDGKEQFVTSRLGKQLQELRLGTFSDYYEHILKDKTGAALRGMIDALTTNHTGFFRESAHFDFLREIVVPEFRKRGRLSVWSAACSTGEEPFSVAFCLLDELGLDAVPRLDILATDISTRVLDHARKGVYAAERFEEVSPARLRNYIRRGEGQWKDWYLVKREIRAAVEFRRLNLMESFSGVASFPVVFCRNVMIYFDRATQESLVNRIAERLEPGGYLLIGHSESLTRLKHPLAYVRPGVYAKPRAARA